MECALMGIEANRFAFLVVFKCYFINLKPNFLSIHIQKQIINPILIPSTTMLLNFLDHSAYHLFPRCGIKGIIDMG